MIRIITSLLFLLTALLNAQDDAWIENYQSNWINYDGGTKLVVTNNNLLPITYKINMELENLKLEIPNNTLVVVPAEAKDYVVVDLKMIKKASWKVKNAKTRVFLGDLTDKEYDEDYIYELPFDTNAAYQVSQGYDGKISHQGKNQLDFSMPVNTKIMACRDGIIVNVVEKNSKSCGQPKCKKFNNYINILHDDGTIMEYLHLKKNGVKVKVGEKVKKGQLIGYSGNVGYSTGPHLHLALFLTDENNKRNYLPTKFKINNGDVVDRLIEKESYSKNY